jgi:ribonucleoside-diphosphate reductase alpha chain
MGVRIGAFDELHESKTLTKKDVSGSDYDVDVSNYDSLIEVYTTQLEEMERLLESVWVCPDGSQPGMDLVKKMFTKFNFQIKWKSNSNPTVRLDTLSKLKELTNSREISARNAQLTVIAPTGTIGMAMDCDTLSIEPDFSLLKVKTLAGGGSLSIVNSQVGPALEGLGYSKKEISNITDYIAEHGNVDHCDSLIENHKAVFDCAVGAERYLSPMAHLKMIAACQPFLSGGISKTVNVPNSTTAEQIFDIYVEAWKLGVKSVSVYRDGSKTSQPLNTKKSQEEANDTQETIQPPAVAVAAKRRRLPDTRNSVTHKFSISAQHDGYITAGMYDDGTVGEVFVHMAKVGSTLNGLVDAFSTLLSISLQYGVPLKVIVDKLSGSQFDPRGMTSNSKIPFTSSMIDYVIRWLDQRFGASIGEVNESEKSAIVISPNPLTSKVTGSICVVCHGSNMIRVGTCEYCLNCSESTGGCG